MGRYATLPANLEAFYPEAVAVLTAPVRFVDWRILKVEHAWPSVAGTAGGPTYAKGDDWQPMALERDGSYDAKLAAHAEIRGPRWIYVFAKPVESQDAPALVEELYLEPHGDQSPPYFIADGPRHTIFATPLSGRRFDGAVKLEPLASRPKGEKIGTTMRFVRRWRGRRMLHYFFSTRARLSTEHVEELRQKVALWVPPTYFEGADPKAKEHVFGETDSSIIGSEGAGHDRLVVPVLDPLIVPTHLHAMFSAASDELLEYVGYEGQETDARHAAMKRQHKLLLARLVMMVLHQDKERRGDLSSENAVEDWIKDYEGQIESRSHQRDLWHTYLWNWLHAEPLAFVNRALVEAGGDFFLTAFLSMMLFISRGNETAAGRLGLSAMLNKDKAKWQWMLDHVVPEKPAHPVKGSFKVARKVDQAVLEAHAPLVATIAFEQGNVKAFGALLRMRTYFELEGLTLDGKPLPGDPAEAARAFHDSPTKKLETGELKGMQKVWKFRFNTMKLAHSALNLAFYFADVVEDPSWKNALGTAGAAASTAKAMVGFMKVAKGSGLALTKELLGYFSGVIDVVLGVKGFVQAVKDGDGRVALGYAMVTTGGFLSSFGGLVLLSAEGGPLIVLGFLIASLGYVFIYFFQKKDPITRFLTHSPWGERRWSKESFDDLSGMDGMEMEPGDLLGQVEVLVNLLCRFELASEDTPWHDATPNFTVARLTMGFLPPGAKLFVGWEEKWVQAPGGTPIESPTTTATYTFTDAGDPVQVAADPRRFQVSRQGDAESHEYLCSGDGRWGTEIASNFQRTVFRMQLVVPVGDQSFTLPKNKPVGLVIDADVQWKKKKLSRAP